MDELFEQSLSPLPALEQARRRVIKCEEELEEAKKSQVHERAIIANGCLFLARQEVARLERERFGH